MDPLLLLVINIHLSITVRFVDSLLQRKFFKMGPTFGNNSQAIFRFGVEVIGKTLVDDERDITFCLFLINLYHTIHSKKIEN